MSNINLINKFLKNSQLFSELNEDSLQAICDATLLKNYGKGELIFCENDLAHSFFVVGSGKVKVFKLSGEGKEQILMIANPGDSFAEAAMFGKRVYPASAQSIENSEVLVFNREKFLKALNKKPDLAFSMIVRLSELLHKLSRLIEELSLTDVTTRLAHYFIKELNSKQNIDKNIITLTEKKSVLASQLGTIPETLSRSLAKLSKQNIIEVSRSEIKILDYDRLHDLANGN